MYVKLIHFFTKFVSKLLHFILFILKVYKKDLEKAVGGDVSGYFKRFLVSLTAVSKFLHSCQVCNLLYIVLLSNVKRVFVLMLHLINKKPLHKQENYMKQELKVSVPMRSHLIEFLLSKVSLI